MQKRASFQPFAISASMDIVVPVFPLNRQEQTTKAKNTEND
jgi:hypothetical protein